MISIRPRALSDEERADFATKLRTEYEAGANIQSLADKHGRSFGGVRRMLLDAGTTLRPRGYAGRRLAEAARGGDA